MFQHDAKAKAWLDDIVARANSAQAIPDTAKDVADKTISPSKRAASFAANVKSSWNQLSGADKTMVGMNFLFAGLMLVEAFSRFRQGIKKDDEGKRHLEPTQLSIGVALSLLGAGSLYIGMKPLQTAHAL